MTNDHVSIPKKKLKFLAFSPMFGRSHTTWMGTLSDLLIDAGHEVVMFAPVFYPMGSGHGSKKARVIEFPQCAAAKARQEASKKAGGTLSSYWTSRGTIGSWEAFKPMKLAMIEQCKEILADTELLDRLRAEQFDAAFTETVDLCCVAIIHALGIKSYAMTISVPTYDWGFSVTGMPAVPSYVPCLMTSFSDRMSFWERRENLMALEYSRKFIDDVYILYDEAIKPRLPDYPGTENMVARSSFIFLNTDPLFDFPRPTVHKVIEIGGITVDVKPVALDAKFDDILNLRKKTVFISFGSVVPSVLMPEQWKKTLIETFKAFPEVTFLWKYEQPEDELLKGVDNLVAVEWAPQVDLLHDPRLSLFITHAGMGSVNEALLAGVPMLVIPVVGDQYRNSQLLKRMGSAEVFDKFDLDCPVKLSTAIKDALNNTNFKIAAVRNSEMLRNRPFAMSEIFVRNMEFMAEYGPLDGLDHYGRQLSFSAYYNLDVIAYEIGKKLSLATIVLGAIGLGAWKLWRRN